MTVGTENARPRAFHPSMAAGEPAPANPPGWDIGPERRIDDAIGLAQGLGWFSIGLGALEVLSPESVTDFLGMDDDQTGLVRFMGFREIASGVGILSQRQPTAWVWSRVAGDLLDLAVLGGALTGRNRHRDRVVGAIGMVAGIAVLDFLCATRLGSR